MIMQKQPHIQLDESIQTDCVILPGDPARVDRVASFMTDVKEEGFNREYKSMTGTYKGKRILVMSTGMGGPSTAIGVEELAMLGVRYAIRIGSCGALQSDLRNGDILVADCAVCDDGTSQTYMNLLRFAAADLNIEDVRERQRIEYAAADSGLVKNCLDTLKNLGFAGRRGATRCHDALYLTDKPEIDEFYSEHGIDGSDMETAALFAVGALRGVKTCSLLNVVVEWKQDTAEGISNYKDGADAAAEGEKHEILTALETLAAIR